MELFLEPRDMAQMRAARSKPKCALRLAQRAACSTVTHRPCLPRALTQCLLRVVG